MACARGCCPTQAEHYRSLAVASSDRKNWTKTTTDEHSKVHTVDVIEHWDGRQDVTVKAPPVEYSFGPKRSADA